MIKARKDEAGRRRIILDIGLTINEVLHRYSSKYSRFKQDDFVSMGLIEGLQADVKSRHLVCKVRPSVFEARK